MSIEMQQEDGGKILAVRISGKLEQEDYKRFVPEVERLIEQHGKIRMLIEMTDFHGWDAGALWEDIKFDVKHFSDIERLAMVGEKRWQKGMSVFCQPFTTAEIRYFERERADEASYWLRQPIASEKQPEGMIILTASEQSEEGFQAQPEELETLIGKSGTAITPLRPAGSAMIEENRVNVVTEGDFIAAGTPIEVMAVEGNRVVVSALSS